jgi:23S rRNA pseudouridine1911/1915/1917 synthase
LEQKKAFVTSEFVGQRLDVFLAHVFPDLTRSRIQNLIKQNFVRSKEKPLKPNHRVKEGEEFIVTIPDPVEISLDPENIDVEIIYEDEDLVVINKPQGMVVHPAVGNLSGTLVNALLYHCDHLSGINGKVRPGIVHRLDKDTSGLLVVAKNDMSHQHLAKQIKGKTVTRIYWALVDGKLKEEARTIHAPIGRHPIERKKMTVVPGGRQAVTHIRVLESFEDATLVEAKLETGRTHQIRVHLAHIGFPIMGDPRYGRKKQKLHLSGQALHAKYLAFVHPTKGNLMEFEAPLPRYFEDILGKLRKR